MTKETPVTSPPATPDQKAIIRSVVFEHLTGMVLVPTLKALWDRCVFQLFDGHGGAVSLDRIVEQIRGNRGYLKVALRLLASSGLLTIRQATLSDPPVYALTPDGVTTIRLVPLLFGEAAAFIPIAIFLEDFLFGKPQNAVHPSLQVVAAKAKTKWELPLDSSPEAARIQERIRLWLDGILVGPSMVALARAGIFTSLRRGPLDLKNITGNVPALAVVFEVLSAQGWIERDHGRLRLTPAGQYAAEIASSYGVTVSYLPLFSVISTLLFGNARIARVDAAGTELLCNRAMNVWGSGGAHKSYFRKVDDAIIQIFNRPIEGQPRGICDMGCGDGTLLEHLHSVIKTRTARGRVLEQHPLVIIGADFNKVARRVSAQRLRKSAIPNFHVIHGDINRPAQLAGDLEELGLDIHDLLHVRSFLDHNRPYTAPANYGPFSRRAQGTGAFAHLGEEICNDELEENLVRHLRRWAPYVGRFGLLLLELHTLAPEMSAAHPAKTPVVAYDGTHGFSDQYLVEAPVFFDLAREAGLVSDERYRALFPPSELATVTLNFFTAPQFAA
jgi:hypothetical protein